MGHFFPGLLAALCEPVVQIRQRYPMLVGGSGPDLPTPVLYILLNNTFLPAGCHIAELGLEQVMTTHGQEAGIDGTLLTASDLVHSSLHIVVDTASWNATKGSKGTGMGIEQHLVALHWISHQPESTGRSQLAVGYLQAPSQSCDPGIFTAPVKLECLAMSIGKWDESLAFGRFSHFLLQFAHHGTDSGIAASIAFGL